MKRFLMLLIVVLAASSMEAQDIPLRVINHPTVVYQCVFSHDGESLMTVCADGFVRLWDVSSGELLTTANKSSSLRMYHVNFSPDGNSVVMVGPHSTVQVWDLLDPGEPWTFESEWSGGGPNIMANFSFDGRKIVLGTNGDSTVRVIDIRTEEEVRFKTSDKRLTWAMASPNSNTLVSVAADSMLRIWTMEGVLVHRYPLYGQASRAMYSPSGQKMIIDRYGSTADPAVIDSNGTMFPQITGHGDMIRHADYSRDERYAVTTDYRGVVRIFKTPLYDFIRALTFPIRPGVRDAALNRDGSLLAICPGDTTVAIYSVHPADVTIDAGAETGLTVRTFPNPISDRLTVELMLERAEHVQIRLVDALGREQMTLVDARMEAGSQTAFMDASSLASGSYLLSVRIGSERTVRRVIVAR